MSVTGVGYPSHIDSAVVTLAFGGANPSYPASNLRNIFEAANPFRSSASAGQVLTYVLPAAKATRLVALVRHNLPTGSTWRVRLFSDANPDPVGNPGAMLYDSGSLSVWPSGAPAVGFSPTRPLVLTTSVLARSGRIDVTPASGIVEIGALEVAGFWEWPGISPGFEFGVDQDENVSPLVGGADEPGSNSLTPRVANGEISYLALGAAVNTALDFQKGVGRSRPFVVVVDASDPTTWSRMCFLATNVDVPPLVGKIYRHDTFQFRFREHLR